jgi:glycosyltransferase involved in cell wall biosynthesis
LLRRCWNGCPPLLLQLPMPEILILCEYPTLNGGERSMLATLDGVRAAGFSPAIIGPPNGPLASELATRGAELIPFQCCAADGSRIPQHRLREELATLLRQRRPALLHANSLAMGRLSGPVAADCGVPSLSHLRDIIRLSAQAVADLNCHRRLLAVSEATRDFHVAHGMDATKTQVLYNGVDLHRFCPRPPTGYIHRELGLSPDIQLVGNIGQIGLRKGQDVLLQAAAMVADRTRTAHYLLFGERNSNKDESHDFEDSLRHAAQGALAGRVHFLGRRDDISSLLNELTLLAHTARQEPLGRVLLEAAAAGVAIVATDVGGTREIFPPEAEAARLVPSQNAAEMAGELLNLLANRPLRERLGANARRRAEEQFDKRLATERLLSEYRSVIERSSPPPAL